MTASLKTAMLKAMGYAGGKAGPGVFHRIISLMPPHQIYIEPFYGGGAITRLKRPARLNIGIDRDRAAVEKARPADLAKYPEPAAPGIEAILPEESPENAAAAAARPPRAKRGRRGRPVPLDPSAVAGSTRPHNRHPGGPLDFQRR